MSNSDAIAKAHEALELFSAIESAGVFDSKDAERLAAANREPESKKSRNTREKERSGAPTAATSSRTAASKNAGVDEAIMTKLHRRNKELTAEVERLRQQLGSAECHEQQPCTSAPDATRDASKRSMCDLALARAETRLLQKQLNEIRAVNLRSIDKGEATGKVNKEVKDFFHLTRQKIIEDAAAVEVERALWNTALSAAEDPC
uniref:Uncharacterized protein n=1 Tax=Neobodo designis TaxID=312471 RepID=A0A7S1MT80_NEODS|mmetsp:Transcript_46378/g.143127  ORF Transcript_46378/g.143127 Transcript_46378/m.143127 type:complete len:204 (+) Transcript_46378:26-637(+)